MKLSALIPGLSILLLAGLPMQAQAGADSGFFLGAGIGQSSIKADVSDTSGGAKFDGDDTGYKVFGGYNFGVVPLVDLAAEIGYVDLGKPDDSIGSVGTRIELDGFTAMGLAGLSFGPFGVFAKAGLIAWDGKSSSGSLSGSDDGTDPAYGLGARFQIGSLGLRAEVEYFDISDVDDAYFASVSALWTF